MCQSLCAQQTTIVLEEVTVSDSQLKHFSSSQSVLVLNDSVIEANQSSLTALLNHNSFIYFKENGLGMVSSPSFRGTTAEQTSVIWNGINVNSQLNGQTDFNTISGSDFNSISVRAGGGSVLYGSSAIGGAVSLNNDMVFGKSFSNNIHAAYASFNTAALAYRLQYGTDKFSSQFSFSANYSDNDYPYPNPEFKNENGQYRNIGFNANFGYRLGGNDFLKFYTRIYDGERHFALISPSDTKTKYRDSNTWHLLEWDHFAGRFASRTKVALLTERYQYYENIQSDAYTFGKSQRFTGKYDLSFDVNEKIRLNSILDFTRDYGRVSENIKENRNIASAALLMSHRLSEKLKYEAGLKKEITDNYESPLLFSAGTLYNITKNYSLKANISKNFRIPTFNDLYWDGLGNPDLKPETSIQSEIGNEFKLKGFNISITAYHMDIRDMIRWIPGSNGVFAPQNTNKVKINGVETALHWNKKINFHTIEANVLYAYNQSENAETGKQLIYVPFHKITASAGYSFRKWSFTVQHLFTDKVYIQTDNSPTKIVSYYNVTDTGLAYDFGKRDTYKLGVNVRNLWDENYQSKEGRYMPQRNFNIYLTLKF
ncbi:TonB-dependent receptor plug domain-containing protein [Flavobacterium pallidum]|uniref:TonB-dependent receptor plug domain-containing protein n=1 Tax=Flavobacterium pallidum TaxID=2172098 RepID=UPI001FE5D52E|nr:TonB-dependent receptor [Flavobacterium pallidum]